MAPCCFARLWKSVQVTEPLDQHQKIRHLAQKTAYTILLKVMTSILPLKKTNTGMNEWAAASRRSNRRMKFPSPNLQKRHGSSDAPAPDYSTPAAMMLLKDICLSWEKNRLKKGSGGFPKKKENLHSLFFFFFFFSPPRCCCCCWWWCRSAQSHWGENTHWKSTG